MKREGHSILTRMRELLRGLGLEKKGAWKESLKRGLNKNVHPGNEQDRKEKEALRYLLSRDWKQGHRRKVVEPINVVDA